MRIICNKQYGKVLLHNIVCFGTKLLQQTRICTPNKNKLHLNLKTSLVVVSPLISKPALHTSTFPRPQTTLKLKPSQNKKGQKISSCTIFWPFLFSQLPAVKKDSKNGAARKFFGPSYFDLALIVVLEYQVDPYSLSGCML